jgi:hypothetical protein
MRAIIDGGDGGCLRSVISLGSAALLSKVFRRPEQGETAREDFWHFWISVANSIFNSKSRPLSVVDC